MSTPGLDSFRSCQSKDTFPNSNDVFLQKHGNAFFPLSKSRFEFVCVCANPCLPSYFPPVPHRSALHRFQDKRKTNLFAEGYSLIDRACNTCFGDLETGFACKSGLLLLIQSEISTGFAGPDQNPALARSQFTTHPQRCIIQRKQEYWVVTPIAERVQYRRHIAEGLLHILFGGANLVANDLAIMPQR